MSAELPRQIGPYQVLELLGQGSLSRVYRATLPLLGGQEFAVKLLRERCRRREVSGFLGECAKVKRLGTHPHIVPLYFAGYDRRLGRYYVAMELVPGSTAAHLLIEAPEGYLSIEQVLRMGSQVASALEHAHQRGILHLDVKPSNILWQPEGTLAKLTDFGSARLREDMDVSFSPISPGTPAYRAWEQTPAGRQAGIQPSERSDMYGLAATLYHLLTGHLPLPANQGQLPPPSQWRADLPPALDTLLLSALHREPQERPATMAEFRRVLEEGGAPQRVYLTSAFPLPTTKLVGRDSLLRTLKQRLLAGETLALAALGGLPGVGKTALAATIVTDPEIQAHFADGMLWAGLGQSPDPLAILGSWAARLGMAPGETAQLHDLEAWAKAVRASIGSRRMLLVLDDAWSIEAALACRVGGPNSAHLLTTRSTELALQFAGMGLLRVPELTEGEGLELLAQLAPQVVTDLPTEAMAVVRAAGGLPLGLVLLGKQLQLHSFGGQPRRIKAALERLLQEGEQLRVGQPQAPADSHPSLPAGTPLSLQASIGLSDASLSKGSQTMLRALSIFSPKPSSFSEEAALAVAGGSAETLDRLVDAGLVETAGPGRYQVHQTIHMYAAEHLAPSTDPLALRRAHAHYYVRLVESLFPHLQMPDLSARLTQIEAEYGNLRAALQWATQQREVVVGLQLATALWGFWYTRGYLLEGWQYLSTFLAEDSPPESVMALRDWQALRAKACYAAGTLAFRHNDLERARAVLNESIRLYDELGDLKGRAAPLTLLGNIALYQGRFEEAKSFYEPCLAQARLAQNKLRCAALLINLGIVARKQGEYQRANSLSEEGLALCNELRDAWTTALALNNLGDVAREQEEYPRAVAFYIESLRLLHSLGNRASIASCLEGLAAVLSCCQQQESAALLYGAALALREQTKTPLSPSDRQHCEVLEAAARSSLGGDRFEAVLARGRGLSLEEAIQISQAGGWRCLS